MSDRKSATRRARETATAYGGGPVTVGVRELRDNLSRYLDLVREGATITVTDHGVPVATLAPQRFSPELLALAEMGVVDLPVMPKGDPRAWPRVQLEGGLSPYLDEVR